MVVDWDWDRNPTYESERLRIDATHAPLVFYDMRLPRQLQDSEVALMVSLANLHLAQDRPMLSLVRHEQGTGVISARHRKAFADWLEDHREALQRDDFAVVLVLPEAIFRAVLRVVYRFRSPPLRTLTTSDVPSATETIRAELARIGFATPPELGAFLDALAAE